MNSASARACTGRLVMRNMLLKLQQLTKSSPRRIRKKFRWILFVFAVMAAAMIYVVYVRKERPLKVKFIAGVSLTVDVPLVRAELFPYRWQTVNSNVDLHVYSAFLDSRNKIKVLRVVGLGSTKEFRIPKPALCFLWDHPSSTKVRVRTGFVAPLKAEKTSLTHINVACNVNDDERPYAVSVSLKMTTLFNNWIPLKYPKEEREFTVCFPAINSGFQDPQEMVQTIEFNRLLGAEKFVIYNVSVQPDVQQVMEYYQERGILNVLDWTRTLRWNEGMIHYWAQETSMFDCLFRNMGVSRWLVFADLDEVIIPRNHSTWRDLLRDLDKTEPLDKAGSLMFLHAPFLKNVHDDMNTSYSREASRLGVLSLLKTRRFAAIGTPSVRSKQIVRPEAVRKVGVHLTHIHQPGFHTRVVPPGLGLVHHYRVWKDTEPEVVDVNTGRFHGALLQRVSEVWNHLRKM